MCTGKRQTHIRNAPSSRTAVTGIDPYESFSNSVGNSELFQITREKTRKTEAVFLVGSRELRGEIEIPPGSFSFGEAKENAVPQSQLFKRGSYIVVCIVDHKTLRICRKTFAGT